MNENYTNHSQAISETIVDAIENGISLERDHLLSLPLKELLKLRKAHNEPKIKEDLPF